MSRRPYTLLTLAATAAAVLALSSAAARAQIGHAFRHGSGGLFRNLPRRGRGATVIVDGDSDGVVFVPEPAPQGQQWSRPT